MGIDWWMIRRGDTASDIAIGSRNSSHDGTAITVLSKA